MATKLCTHKAECAQINDAQIRALPEKAFTFTARDDAQDDAALALLRSSCVAPSELKLKPGAQVRRSPRLSSPLLALSSSSPPRMATPSWLRSSS